MSIRKIKNVSSLSDDKATVLARFEIQEGDIDTSAKMTTYVTVSKTTAKSSTFLVDTRKFYYSEDEDTYLPTRKGITIRIKESGEGLSELRDIINVLTKVADKIESKTS
jgi:hypothetical protein